MGGRIDGSRNWFGPGTISREEKEIPQGAEEEGSKASFGNVLKAFPCTYFTNPGLYAALDGDGRDGGVAGM